MAHSSRKVATEDKERLSPRALIRPCPFEVIRRRDSHSEEGMMSHDKIKAAARERMARTGESYVAARYEVIKTHAADGDDRSTPNMGGFAAADISSLPESIRQVTDFSSPLSEMFRQAADITPLMDSIRQAADVGPLMESVRESMRQAADVGPLMESMRRAAEYR
jgi:hypothetical protein